jgi:diguanylate cyclase (GGDEF)-like protein/PAS domain S-box-containing protein
MLTASWTPVAACSEMDAATLIVVGLIGLTLTGSVFAMQRYLFHRRAVRAATQMVDLLEVSSEGILIHHHGRILEANGAFCRFVACDRDQVIGRNVLQFVSPGTPVPILRHLTGIEGGPDILHIGLVGPNKVELPTSVSVRPLRYKGMQTLAIALRDMTETIKTEDRAEYLASHDALTGLLNPIGFERRIAEAMAMSAHHNRPVALLRLDVDRFKAANEEWGHAAGDRILQLFARRLNEASNANDILARLGGDNFAILMPRLDQTDAAVSTAGRLLDVINKPYLIDGRTMRLTASIGAAVYPGNGDTPGALLSNAWAAMLRAKKEGPGRLCFFEHAMDEALRRKFALRSDLRAAVSHRRLDVHYQPLVDCRSLEIAGYEALLRWTHPVLGSVSPAEFVPIAEEISLIGEIGAWVIETACAEAASWQGEAFVAVNLSPAQFLDPDLPNHVASILKRTNLPAARLELEVTEGVLINDPERAMETLMALKSQGICIALDDFGTGYSSLSYVHRFPFDRIKIDQSFVQAMGKSAQADAIVKAVMALGHSLNLLVTAEGVETLAQFNALRERNCDIAQGFLFSRAVPASAIRGLHYDLEAGQLVRGKA